MAGRVVILNGASSAGKSSLARRFRDDRAAAGEPWLIVGLDDFLEKLPKEWFIADGYRGPHGPAGVRFEKSADGVIVTVGEVGRRLLGAYRRAVAACALAGFDVLVDEVTFDEGAVEDWRDALRGLRVTWVAIRCDADVAEARERRRADRQPGLARGQSEVVHRWAPYDATLDTTDTTVDELSAELARLLDRPDG